MEPVEFKERDIVLPEKPWATTGNKDGEPRRIINSLFIDAQALEDHVHKLYRKYDEMKRMRQGWSAITVRMQKLLS